MIHVVAIALFGLQQLSAQDQLLYKSAVDLQRQDKVEKAIVIYRKVLHKEPKVARVWFDLGSAYMQKGAVERAAEAYKRAHRLEPGNDDYERKAKGVVEALAKPFVDEGFAQLNSQTGSARKYVSAVESFQKALTINPDDHVVWYHLGKCYQGLKEYRKARTAFGKAIALYSDNAYKDALEEVGGKKLSRDLPQRERYGDFGTGE